MTGVLRFRWRHVRWVLLAAALPAIWACNSPTLAKPNPTPERVVNKVFEAAANRDVDIVFMIDNSPSMRPLQEKLARNFPQFMAVLSGLPGGLPNVRIAVISSNLGAGPTAPTQLCPIGGDLGAFQATPRGNAGACTTGLPAGVSYLQSIKGVKNFTGEIADAFSCIAQLGDAGCGFEHQFASMLRALEPGPNQPPGNKDFLRDGAYLSLILITNEDDCSAPPDSPMFDPMSRTVMDMWGPLASFRCNENGHRCGGMKPPRMAMTFDATTCVSAEDGVLLNVKDVIDRTKALKKGDASKILPAAIMGIPNKYEVFIPTVAMQSEGYLPSDVPAIRHSCTNPSDSTYADPGVRIDQWLKGFPGDQDSKQKSICDVTFTSALEGIAKAIGKALEPQCVEGKLVDTDGNLSDGNGGRNIVTPECILSDVSNGGKTETPIPSCKARPGAVPCWEALLDDGQCAPEAGKTKTYIKVTRMNAMPSESSTSVACSICIAGREDPGCAYDPSRRQ